MGLAQLINSSYVRALIIFIGFFIVSKIVIYVSEKIILKFTKRTKTDIDDLIIKGINKPISVLLMLIGAKLALIPLGIRLNISLILQKILSSFMVIIVVYIGLIITDIIIVNWGKKFAEKTESTIDDNIVSLAHKSTKIIFFIIVLLMVLSIWDIQISPLLASLGIAGIAVAFALQSTLGNIFGGISLILDKSIKVGDIVYLEGNAKGKILDIGLRSTKLKTFDNEVIIIPNGKLSNMNIQNIVQPEPSARVVVSFSVAYGSDIKKVKDIVLKEIKKIEGLKKEPKPLVRFREMGDSALIFKAYFYVEHYSKRFGAIDKANELIYNSLNKNKIKIPFPQMDVYLKK